VLTTSFSWADACPPIASVDSNINAVNFKARFISKPHKDYDPERKASIVPDD
jgi:hypothetical protein